MKNILTISLLLMGSMGLASAQEEGYPKPPSPTPTGAETVESKAGYGSSSAYASAGVMEVGGSLALLAATDYFSFDISPSAGWFIADNLKLEGMLSVNYTDANNEETTLGSLLLGPSYHLPFSNTKFFFLGVKVGPSYSTVDQWGFGVRPEVGLNFLVGRSGVLTPKAFVQYNTIDSQNTSRGTAIFVSVTYGVGVGYTVML